jgi:hypothetical protein
MSITLFIKVVGVLLDIGDRNRRERFQECLEALGQSSLTALTSSEASAVE